MATHDHGDEMNEEEEWLVKGEVEEQFDKVKGELLTVKEEL